MNRLDKHTLLFDACNKMRYQAKMTLWDGRGPLPDSCRWFIERYSATAVYTRDVGYHSGGWWKNPDYERCWHLSISFRGGSEKKALARMLDNLFGEHQRWLWVEPPYSAQGKSMDVWHYRLFCDENWQPIKPRGEVYDTCFTERGWKSFSELQANKIL